MGTSQGPIGIEKSQQISAQISDDDVFMTDDQIPIAQDASALRYSPGLKRDCGERLKRP